MTGDDLKQKFDTQWGAFRRYIALHPLTGFWGGFLIGAFLSGVVKMVGHGLGLA